MSDTDVAHQGNPLDLKFFSLLHVSEHSDAVNSAEPAEDVVGNYIANAVNLMRSLASYGQRFALITNDAQRIRAYLRAVWPSADIELFEIEFTTEIPAAIGFYAAHHKFDVIRYLGGLRNVYSVLLDLDVTLNSEGGWNQFMDYVTNGLLLWYDISDQVGPAYGRDRISSDMKRLDSAAYECKWAGGEFIGGSPAAFFSLYEHICRLLPGYFACYSQLHHEGDEMVISVALEAMRRGGHRMTDAGSVGIIGRFWFGATQHLQRPWAHYLNFCLFLHLPQGKAMLARAAKIEVGSHRSAAVGCMISGEVRWLKLNRLFRGIRRKFRGSTRYKKAFAP